MSEMSSAKNRKIFQNRFKKTYFEEINIDSEKAHIRFCGFDRDQSFFPFCGFV